MNSAGKFHKLLFKYHRHNSTKIFAIIFGAMVIFATIPLTVFLTQRGQDVTKNPQAATVFSNTLDQLINTRPDHANLHAVHLPLPMYDWTWGQHGTEDNKSSSLRSVNLWLAMLYDQSNVGHVPNVKLNVRRMYGYALNGSTWTKIYDGLPTWYVSTPDTGGGYVDISPTRESDGSYSFTVPMNLMIHMSTPAPGLQISGSQGIVSVVEARLLGTAADIAASKLALSAGADYRDAAGSGGSIDQSGFGQGGLLTADWQAYDMISTTLTDAQIRSNPPPGFTTTTDNPPTVSITSPANGVTITAGTSVSINASATDDKGISKVEFYIDGALKTPADTTLPYTYPWNTTGLSGSHTTYAKATDTTGQVTQSAIVTITVNLTTTKIGDLNNDGKVNIFDASTLFSNWNSTTTPAYDLSHNGKVDIFDASILFSNWTG
ncbi:MAG: Ig-like domain-containing protein [Candidatus Saccharibacteria bacterium]|nr:Ig-like domain-containing protein [Candidatus Saccharibacteria bacterium]